MRAPSRGWTTPIALAIALVFFSAAVVQAATVTIAWDPSPDQSVVGYQVYVGTSPGSYSETFDVGLATSFTYSPRDETVRYFAVAAYAAGPVVGPLSIEVSAPPKTNSSENYWSSLWTVRADPMRLSRHSSADAAPAVTIAIPTTTQNNYYSDQSFLALAGTAWDAGVVTEVTWMTDRGHSGRATGTDNWIAGVPLKRGKNTITVLARDDDGNVSSQVIVVHFSPATRQTFRSTRFN